VGIGVKIPPLTLSGPTLCIGAPNECSSGAGDNGVGEPQRRAGEMSLWPAVGVPMILSLLSVLRFTEGEGGQGNLGGCQDGTQTGASMLRARIAGEHGGLGTWEIRCVEWHETTCGVQGIRGVLGK